jgi:hypothetical protein
MAEKVNELLERVICIKYGRIGAIHTQKYVKYVLGIQQLSDDKDIFW